MSSKIVGITGASGFIGGAFLPTLVRNYETVISYGRDGSCRIFSGSIYNYYDFQLSQHDPFFRPNILYNFATRYDPGPSSIADVGLILNANISFPLSIISKVDHEELKIINFCSYMQLVSGHEKTVYSLSKSILALTLKHAQGSLSNIYLFDTFGTGDTRGKVVDVFIKSIMARQAITIPKNPVFVNISHVDDICYSIYPAERVPIGESCVLSQSTISLEGLALEIMNVIGHRVNIRSGNDVSCAYSSVEGFPPNIYRQLTGDSFSNKLAQRVSEINETHPVKKSF